MAVIKELNGGKIRIHDDCFLKTEEENTEGIQKVVRMMAIGGERKRKAAK